MYAPASTQQERNQIRTTYLFCIPAERFLTQASLRRCDEWTNANDLVQNDFGLDVLHNLSSPVLVLYNARSHTYLRALYAHTCTHARTALAQSTPVPLECYARIFRMLLPYL